MAKIIQVSWEEAEEGRKKMEEILAEDEFWQKELREMKQFDEEEKLRREVEYAELIKSEQTQQENQK